MVQKNEKHTCPKYYKPSEENIYVFLHPNFSLLFFAREKKNGIMHDMI